MNIMVLRMLSKYVPPNIIEIDRDLEKLWLFVGCSREYCNLRSNYYCESLLKCASQKLSEDMSQGLES